MGEESQVSTGQFENHPSTALFKQVDEWTTTDWNLLTTHEKARLYTIIQHVGDL